MASTVGALGRGLPLESVSGVPSSVLMIGSLAMRRAALILRFSRSDSSSFSKLRGDGYRLMFTLKNTAGFEVAMPAMELTLTDIQDQPVIRRVLQPQEFGGNTVSLGVLSEWQAQLTLSASGGGQRIAGYRLLAFYP